MSSEGRKRSTHHISKRATEAELKANCPQYVYSIYDIPFYQFMDRCIFLSTGNEQTPGNYMKLKCGQYLGSPQPEKVQGVPIRSEYEWQKFKEIAAM